MKKLYPLKKCLDYLEDLEGDAPEKACISCTHRHFDSNKDHNYCDIDKHYIGYFALWGTTCKHHELEKDDNDE